MNSQSYQQTLQRSRQITRKYEQYLKQRQIYLKQSQQTNRKLEKTINLASETIKSVGQTQNKLQAFQTSFKNAIDNIANRISSQDFNSIDTASELLAKISNEKEVAELIDSKQNIFILTGAGISLASGINTFRGNGGYWEKKGEQQDPKKILTLQYFEEKPDEVWDWLISFYKAKIKAKPNVGHIALAEIMQICQKKKRNITLVTQNIDNLHREANQELQLTKNMKKLNIKKQPIKKNQQKIISNDNFKYFQIHGNINKLRCQKCSTDKKQLVVQNTNFSLQTKLPYHPPLCQICKSALRPHIMFFDESYSENINKYNTIQGLRQKADLLIVIGTKLQTGFANSIVRNSIKSDIDIVQINVQQQIKRGKTKYLGQKSQIIIPKILAVLKKL